MANNNTTTNKVKKPIINNDEALRMITLIQQGDSPSGERLGRTRFRFYQGCGKAVCRKGAHSRRTYSCQQSWSDTCQS